MEPGVLVQLSMKGYQFVTRPAARDPRNGVIWASLDHGHWGPKLSRSKDAGESWEDVTSVKYPKGTRHITQYLPTPEFDAVAPVGKPEYSNASVYKIWMIAFGHASQPGRMYAGTIPGGLFVSDDGGDSWELNRPLWNHESRGGETWQSFRNGLPQQNAYDIVLRHSLDYSQDCLCFGSTTGNVYLSEDRGETWQCLANNMPPIYSVRFG